MDAGRTETDAEIIGALEAWGDQWQFRSSVGSHQFLRLYELVRKYIPQGATVLDWGAARGHFSYFLMRSGYRATGYSLFAEEVPPSLKDGEYRLVVGNPTDPVTLPFEDNSFDAVASVGVLEHVRETGGDEVASLREIRRVLRPDGTFLCFHFPNRHSWIDAGARMTGSDHHLYRFTQGDIRSLVRSVDMQLVGMKRYACLPRNPLHRLPDPIVHSERFARAFDVADRFLGAVLPVICTNHYFVARKPQPPDGDPPLTTIQPASGG